MVVKEKRGRKRYILFECSGDLNRIEIETLIVKEINPLKSKIKCKLITFNGKKGILLVGHNLLDESRKIMNQKQGINTIASSGTLKGLNKY
tara:strand:+ start:248 stop:520 length:273 start_codon:yes stop_codon:yes gene_type:complete